MPLPSSMPLYEVAPPISQDPVSVTFMLKDLARSGLVPEDMDAYPMLSIAGIGQYVIPYHTPQMWVRRIDTQTDKYRGPKSQTDLYIPKQYIKAGTKTLYLIEGEKKVVKFNKQFPQLQAIGIRGCRGYALNKTLHPTLLANLHGIEHVRVVFDADIESNHNIQHAAHTLAQLLEPLHVSLEVFKPPMGKGADDWLVEDPYAILEDLVPVDLSKLEMGRKQILDKAGIILNDKGAFDRNEAAAAAILATWFKGRAYRDKRLGVIVDGKILPDLDTFEYECVEFMQVQISGKYKLSPILWGIERALQIETRDLVKDLFAKLEWDGVPRLDTWGSEYLPSDNLAQSADWGRMLIRALTNRVIDPGCQVDTVFVIVGNQGTYKSTFLEELSSFDGRKFYYALDTLPMGDSKNIRYRQVACSESIIVDMAEGRVLDTYKSNVEDLKQFISQREDTIQVLYKGKPQKAARGFILCAATNRSDFIADQSGSRRFTVITTGANKLKRLPYEVKLQLIAEAIACPDSNWFQQRVKYEEVDEKIRAANPHIQDPQELLNLAHAKYDGATEFIYQLLESGDVPTLATGQMFIAVKYVVDRWNDSNRELLSSSLASKILTSMMSSPTCPYKFSKDRKRISQLQGDKVQIARYANGITNTDTAISGYVVLHK